MPFLTALRGELFRQTVIWRAYRFSSLGSIVTLSLAFVILILTFRSLAWSQGVAYGTDEALAALVGVLIWNLCASSLGGIAYMLSNEAEAGTLEMMLLSPRQMQITVFIRAIAMSARQLFDTTIMGLILILLLGLRPQATGQTILITFLTLVGAWGIGFAFGGLALVYKSVTRIASLVANLAIFASGALVPLNSLGEWFTVIRLGVPTALGIDLLRKTTIEGVNVANGEIVVLLIQTLLLIVIGLLIFQWGNNRARQLGSLSAY